MTMLLQLFSVVVTIYLKGLPTDVVGVPDIVNIPLEKCPVTPGGNVPKILMLRVSIILLSATMLVNTEYLIGVIAESTATVCESVAAAEFNEISIQEADDKGLFLQEHMIVVVTTIIMAKKITVFFIVA
jgi:hypothetical protein